MQHPDTGHAHAKRPVTFREIRTYSNLAANNLRGHLAEFIVATDLGVAHKARVEWDSFDLETMLGVTVEVKSAAYLQSWSKDGKFSPISFGIAPSVPWDETVKARVGKSVRSAKAYVFCLLAHKEKSSLDPLDLDQWKFFVLPSSILDKELGSQKTLTLQALRKLAAVECSYGEIGRTIERVLDSREVTA